MEEIGEEEEFSRQLTKVESVTTFPGNALVRELGDNAELWPPPSNWLAEEWPFRFARMYHRSARHVSRVPQRFFSNRISSETRNIEECERYFLLSRSLVNTRVKLYIYIYIPHARFPLSFLYREERFSRRCGLIGGLRPLSPLPFLIYEAECCRVTNAEYRLNFKTKFRRVGGMVNSRDGASVVPNNYMRLYR